MQPFFQILQLSQIRRKCWLYFYYQNISWTSWICQFGDFLKVLKNKTKRENNNKTTEKSLPRGVQLSGKMLMTGFELQDSQRKKEILWGSPFVYSFSGKVKTDLLSRQSSFSLMPSFVLCLCSERRRVCQNQRGFSEFTIADFSFSRTEDRLRQIIILSWNQDQAFYIAFTFIPCRSTAAIPFIWLVFWSGDKIGRVMMIDCLWRKSKVRKLPRESIVWFRLAGAIMELAKSVVIFVLRAGSLPPEPRELSKVRAALCTAIDRHDHKRGQRRRWSDWGHLHNAQCLPSLNLCQLSLLPPKKMGSAFSVSNPFKHSQGLVPRKLRCNWNRR